MKRIFTLKDIVSHPEIFDTNYNNIIGNYLIFDEGNLKTEYDCLDYKTVKKEYDLAMENNDSEKIMALSKALVYLNQKKAEGESPFVYEPFNKYFFDKKPDLMGSPKGVKQLSETIGLSLNDLIKTANDYIGKNED